mmetsp:Transcript_39002/g.117251  ORF Transcript_39002/g.117251 Transcript_39002/m.117251 type:complete len:244 (-) Transcript_39002:173-904(-)|eukprot:CAMPEP_0113527710 /NCGR_PEP_ID=MMETSP0015_2-20120614/1443_1 /TAXON_ID=2838 /ORGANISM="Odontella" /LENGTH=243 /DNA_ID=CAMNT_0000426167 /DNA_START=72 /DNA_END=803 /DNA_ORIENTATION=+ /assembly_acc=CAM_ASM_000160
MNLLKFILSSSAAFALSSWNNSPVLVAATEEPTPTCWECGITASNVDLFRAIDPNVDGILTTLDLVIFTKFWQQILESTPVVCKSDLYALYQNGNGPHDKVILAMIDYIGLAGDGNGCVVFEDMISCLRKVILGVCPITIQNLCEDCGITKENLWKWNAIDPSLDGQLTTYDLVKFGQLWVSMGNPDIVCLGDLYEIYELGNGEDDPTIAAWIDYILELVDGDCVEYEFMIGCLKSVILHSCP